MRAEVASMPDRLLPAGTSRRGFLASSLVGFGAAALGEQARAWGLASSIQSSAASEVVVADALDAALERVQAAHPTLQVHRSNHAPMVVEALAELGRADAIAPWVEHHLGAVGPDAKPSGRVGAEHWREALAQADLFPDWRELILAELRAEDWKDVVRRWVPRFVPGLPAVATHGVIRTAHAARALGARDNEVRRAELATGLAYWAVNYEELPWDGSRAPAASVAEALAKVQRRQPEQPAPRGNIVTGLRALAETPSFLPVAGFVGTSDPERALGEMASAFARLYLQNPAHRIAFTHAITAPSALRLLAPLLDEETVIAATRYAWQAAAGLYVVYGTPQPAERSEQATLGRAELVQACVDNGAAHSIKLTEACLREEALSGDPILLAAAQDAGQALEG
jgi:hypothetical protein